MKLLDRIKNAIFEDDELEVMEKEQKQEIKEQIKEQKEEIARQIDVEKTIPKRSELSLEEELDLTLEDDEDEVISELPKREYRKTPVIFDEEDFIMEEENMSPARAYYDDDDDFETLEEPKKHLYGGYRDDKPREKFKPSPVLSPVYGYVGGASPILEKPRSKKKSSFNEMLKEEKKDKVTIDKVREKAYGATAIEEEKDLLYDMQSQETPAISKITIGDAEEYFEDLGLEYNVDYKDSAKAKETIETEEKPKRKIVKKTEEELQEEKIKINQDISLPELEDIPNLEETGPIESVDIDEVVEAEEDLEITKEQLKPKSADEIKKVKKITDVQLEPDTVIDDDEPDEKNLYDLIDMMYESKE